VSDDRQFCLKSIFVFPIRQVDHYRFLLSAWRLLAPRRLPRSARFALPRCGRGTGLSIAGEERSPACRQELARDDATKRAHGGSLGMPTRDQNARLADLIFCASSLVALGILALLLLVYVWK